MLCACGKQEPATELPKVPFLQSSSPWVDSLLLTMSLEEKIAQLIVYQPQVGDSLQQDSLIRLVGQYTPGGVILQGIDFNGYFPLYDTLQEKSRIPLFNASREVVSLHNHFSDLPHLPTAATISAINDETLKQKIRDYYTDQLDALGFNLTFATNLGLNASDKPFDQGAGEAEEALLLQRSSVLLSQVQEAGVLSVAGTFDEWHYNLLSDTTGVLDSTVCRYRTMSEQGLSGVLAADQIFGHDSLETLPPHFLKRYLKEQVGFEGLIFADWEQQSFRNMAYAGVDVFMIKDNFHNRLDTISQLVKDGVFTLMDLNEKVQKVLLAKAWLGLDTLVQMPDQKFATDLMEASFNKYDIHQMYEASISLVQNPGNILPYTNTYKQPFHMLQLEGEDLQTFQNSFSKYASFASSKLRRDTANRISALKLSSFTGSKVLLTLRDVDLDRQKDAAFIKSVNQIADTTEVVILNFGNPVNLSHFDTSTAMIQIYEYTPLTASLGAQLLFGALQAKGQLPLALNSNLPYQHKIDTTAIIRMKYTVPEEVGIAPYKLVGIDAIARNMIQSKATPGCQVLVAKDGKVIYSKSFGKHSFDQRQLVQNTDLYDLASITKIAATTMSLMKLYDEQKIKISHPLKQHLDLEKSSKLKNINLRQLLTHQSGLQPNMPIAPFIMYEDTTGTGCSDYFCKEKKLSYITPVADSFYMDFKWQDSIWQAVYDLKPRRRKRYRYSDVNFNLLMKVIEKQGKISLDDYVDRHFYQPMNLKRITYNPLDRFGKRSIVPTTQEERFRKQLIHGYVHDESAALLGGVGGNAGLFGNAESLAILFQMLLNDGEYGGQKYLTKETIDLFTKKQRNSNRGLGFDVNTKSGTNACSSKASPATYGHTGFTGTCIWVDPEEDLIFVFLSNRIHPDIKNRTLFRKQIRKRMHNVVYEALNTYPEPVEEEDEEEFMEANVSAQEE